MSTMTATATATNETTPAVSLDFDKARFNMIEQQIRPWEVLDPEVLQLLGVVRREDFVPPAYRMLAFSDLEVPLAQGQVMLAPKVEARMLQELAVQKSDVVLEIGAGSGYMAALLAARAEFVFTVEIDPALAALARQNLEAAGVANVVVEEGDAAQGWEAHAPYDAIVVSAALAQVPASLLAQLKVGGRMVAIVGSGPMMDVQLITRTRENTYNSVVLFETATAPLRQSGSTATFTF